MKSEQSVRVSQEGRWTVKRVRNKGYATLAGSSWGADDLERVSRCSGGPLGAQSRIGAGRRGFTNICRQPNPPVKPGFGTPFADTKVLGSAQSLGNPHVLNKGRDTRRVVSNDCWLLHATRPCIRRTCFADVSSKQRVLNPHGVEEVTAGLIGA